MKSIIFVSLLVAAIAIPLAEAQVLPNLINVNGAVSCSANASVPGTTVTPFPNAGVQLQCGGTPIANTTTSGTGTLSIVLNSVNLGLVTSLLTGGCRVVVTTPLAACNVSLGNLSGLLTSVLQLASPNTIPGLPSIPALPSLLPSLSGLPSTLNLIAATFGLSGNV